MNNKQTTLNERFEEQFKKQFIHGGISVLLDYPPHERVLDEGRTLKFIKQEIALAVQQEREKGGYLNYFSYDDWKIGEDDKLRVGDYIYANHQSPHDGYEREIEGKIVLHQTNDLPVMLFNFKIDEDGEEIGDYADLQELMMQGWTFTRLESIKAINQDHE